MAPKDETSEAASDRQRGRRVRRLMDYCAANPAVPLFVVAFVLFGRHPAMELIGLEEPAKVASTKPDRSMAEVNAKLDALAGKVEDLGTEVRGVQVQVRNVQQDVLELALKRADAGMGQKLAQVGP